MTDAAQQLPAALALPAHEDALVEGVARDFELRFGYRIGRLDFVLEKTLVTEILIKPTIYSIPNSPPWLHGMLNLRGNILPIIDLAAVLGTDLKASPGEFVLVIDKGPGALALLVDGLPRSLVDPLPADTLSETKFRHQEFMQTGVRSEQAVWNQLDVKALVENLVGLAATGAS